MRWRNSEGKVDLTRSERCCTCLLICSGVEDIASEVEENIAVVTFGGRSNIAQHLTNDFSLVRDSIGQFFFYTCQTTLTDLNFPGIINSS